jgi:uncharacterized protein YecE (DUF72 family)
VGEEGGLSQGHAEHLVRRRHGQRRAIAGRTLSTARKPQIRNARFHVGVGGWNFAPWRGEFYPSGVTQARELEYMAGQLNSLEINSTFYGLQKPATFQRWHDATPEDFIFAAKAPRFVTGRRDLATAASSIERFLESGVTRLGAKLGPINWQLAPGKPFVAAEVEAFLSLLPARQDGLALRHAVEVRHESFAVPQFVKLARSHGVAIVLAGDSDYPQIAEATAPFAYLRIMGTQETEQRGYSAAALTRWAKRAREIEAGGREVFLYVISGAKRRNPAAARALLERLG